MGTQKEKDENLMKACQKNDFENAKYWLEAGANASYSYFAEGTWGARDRISPIHHAISHENEPLINLLLDHGADANAIQESYNWKGSGSTNTAFQMAFDLLCANPILLGKFIKNGADINKQIVREAHTMRYDGRTQESPLHVAAQQLQFEAIKVLLEAKAPVDARRTERGQSEYGTGEDTDETALHIVCLQEQNGNVEALKIARLLLDYGADVNAVRKFLVTETVETKDNNHDPRSDDYESPYHLIPSCSIPLHIAIQHKNADLVWLLIARGADLSVPYILGKTQTSAWELAERSNDKNIQEALHSRWNPEHHKDFSNNIRDAIYSLLLISKQQKWKFDQSIMFRIFTFVAAAYHAETRKAELATQKAAQEALKAEKAKAKAARNK